MEKGRLIPFFGAGVNLCNRPAEYNWEQPWEPNPRFLPSGAELSKRLAVEYSYPADDWWNLLRVAQYVAAREGPSGLDEELQEYFDHDFPVTPLHKFFAGVPKLLRDRGCEDPNLLIVTTNYDDLMERALNAADEEFDVVSYIRDGEDRGKFQHEVHTDDQPADKQPTVVHSANDYKDVSIAPRTVVLKIHGTVQRTDPENGGEPGESDDDSKNYNFVITEDNYIDFLAQGNITKKIPILLRRRFSRCQFLFMGYGLADWNMRAFFNGVQAVQRAQRRSFTNFAVQLKPKKLEQEFWDDRNVTIYDMHLDNYTTELKRRLEALPVQGGTS